MEGVLWLALGGAGAEGAAGFTDAGPCPFSAALTAGGEPWQRNARSVLIRTGARMCARFAGILKGHARRPGGERLHPAFRGAGSPAGRRGMGRGKEDGNEIFHP